MGEATYLPDAKHVPDAGKLPTRFGTIINFAENDELTTAFRLHCSERFRWYETQAPRKKFCGTGGTMDLADKMWRVSLQRDSTSVQSQPTLSNVTSPNFHILHRTLTTGENTIFFQDDRLPAEFEPKINTDEYLEADGIEISKQQNALEQYIFDSDKRRDKVKELTDFTNRYGMQIVGMEYVREEQEITQNLPDYKAGKIASGRWAKFKRVTQKRVTKDWPSLFRIPVEDADLDPYITTIEGQRCWGYRRRMGPEHAYSGQASGEFLNAEKLTKANLFVTDQQPDKTADQRMLNAGENAIAQLTGEIEYWYAWARVPILVDGNTAKWAPNEAMPEWYLGVFGGNIHDGKSVCLRLIKNPYWCKQLPYTIVREMNDDKGAYPTGCAELIRSLYYQSTTNINQYIEACVYFRNRSHFLCLIR